ncbi:MAG TPA: tetratricopeptide repeat protein [Bacteroidales bacterium]|nr:tetratricopeptide repeat protein [Bacteroidales bacterium]
MMRTTLMIALACLLAVAADAQDTKKDTDPSKKKVVRLNPVKVDTTSANRKALSRFSKDNMFNVSTPPKPLKPEEVRAMGFFNEGSRKGKAGDFAGAVEEFTKSLDLIKNPNSFAKRAYAYMMLGNYGAAINDANQTLALRGDYLKAYFVRGICRFETGDIKNAKQDLDIYLDQDRTNAIAFNYMAAIAFMNQDFKGALENYNEVYKRDPNYPDIHTNRGMMRHYNQDFKGAIQDYDEELKLRPNNAAAYNNRGAAKMMLKDFTSAMADLNKALEIDPKYADAYDNRARIKQSQGDTEGACADWQQAYSFGLQASRDMIIKYCK